MNTYTQMTTRSKWVAIMVKNLMAALMSIAKGVKVTQVVAANAVPQVEAALGTLQKLDEQRKEMLFQQLELSGLGGSLKKPNSHPSPTSWILQHLFLGTWRVRLYWPGKAWDQSCWWWALQGEVLANSPTYGGWGPYTCEGNVGSGHYSPEPEPMV